jgi:L-ascorbate metabolism protein UlaG (beta-lactamase superfamily)
VHPVYRGLHLARLTKLKKKGHIMKKSSLYVIMAAFVLLYGTGAFCMDNISFEPINHATFVIKSPKITVYVDPVGDKKAFDTFPEPDLILITDIHRDHLDTALVSILKKEKTAVIGPEEVIEQLKYGTKLKNGETLKMDNILLEAVPSYNITAERLSFHPKGRGNGYVLTIDEKRIYISGDTEDIPEMRQMKNIDFAFICMNLPYTMTVEQAASAVLEMKPGTVFPYHYRGKEGMSDLNQFKILVQKDEAIQVKLMKWYDK